MASQSRLTQCEIEQSYDLYISRLHQDSCRNTVRFAPPINFVSFITVLEMFSCRVTSIGRELPYIGASFILCHDEDPERAGDCVRRALRQAWLAGSLQTWAASNSQNAAFIARCWVHLVYLSAISFNHISSTLQIACVRCLVKPRENS